MSSCALAPCAEHLSCELEDLLMELNWVQDNIASFGGNPRAVTLEGQSTGADCVRALRRHNLRCGGLRYPF